MASRGKHLLEAFKVAGPNAPAPPHAAPSGGPSPQGSSASRPSSVPSIGSLSKPAAAAPTVIALNAAQLRLFGLVVLLLVVVAFLFGRISVSRVAIAANSANEEAALDSDPASASIAPAVSNPAPRSSASAPQAPTQDSPQFSGSNPSSAPAGGDFDSKPRTPAEQALLDRANIYTVKLIHYTNTEANKRLAASTARYVIEQQNLPAVVAADSTGLYILVGAAPRQVDLDGFLARAKKMPGPPPLSKPAEFHSAYVEKIDRVFRREK